MPETLEAPFIFYYVFGKKAIVFVGEDPHRELSANCVDTDFNCAIWPSIYDICRSNMNFKKQAEKIKLFQQQIQKNNNELLALSRKLKYRMFDLHTFYDISNELFTIYDEKRLLETYARAVNKILKPDALLVFTNNAQKQGHFDIAVGNARNYGMGQSIELSPDSDVYKLLAANDRALRLPLLSSGLPRPDKFVNQVMAAGFVIIEKLQANEKIQGFVLMGKRQNNSSYSEADLEVFSTITNMASLALSNIHHYKITEKMSYTDSMTGLYNYRYFYKRLNEEIFRAKRFGRMLALMIFDIDNFKIFNDTYGHQAGDEVLKNLADLVVGSVRAIDIVSRYGGEEFCVIMPDTGFANSLIFIERLRKKVEACHFESKYVKGGYNITVSIGGAVYPVDALTADRLIYCADMALLKAKADGRNLSMMFNSMMLEDKELKSISKQQLTDSGINEDL